LRQQNDGQQKVHISSTMSLRFRMSEIIRSFRKATSRCSRPRRWRGDALMAELNHPRFTGAAHTEEHVFRNRATGLRAEQHVFVK
jgi:hypothetical protein